MYLSKWLLVLHGVLPLSEDGWERLQQHIGPMFGFSRVSYEQVACGNADVKQVSELLASPELYRTHTITVRTTVTKLNEAQAYKTNCVVQLRDTVGNNELLTVAL